MRNLHKFIKPIFFTVILCLYALIGFSTNPPEFDIEVFPNPATEFVQIELCESGFDNLWYEIVSITGQVQKHGKISQDENFIWVNDLQSGQYILKLIAKDFYQATVFQKNS